jgi:hypothetical protein
MYGLLSEKSFSKAMITYKKKENQKLNHVAHRAKIILQKPSSHSGMHWLRFPIRICIDSGLHIQTCIDSGYEQVDFVSFKKNYLTSLRHQMTSERQNYSWSVKSSSCALIWGTTQYCFFDFKMWPCGTPFSTAALTMKVMGDGPSKLIS